MRTLLISGLLSFFVFGCSSMKTLEAPAPVDKTKLWDLIWDNQEQRRAQIETIRAKVALSLVEKKGSLSGTGMLLSAPEGFRLELRDPLGRLQYSVAQSKGGQFFAYYPSQNVAYYDSSDGRNYLKTFLKLDMKFSHLKDLWFGVLPFGKEELKLVSMTPLPETTHYRLAFNKSDQKWSAIVDSTTGDILKLRCQDAKLRADFEFSEFARCCETHLSQSELPRIGRNVYLKNNGASEIELDWSQIEPAQDLEPQMFISDIPDGVKKIKVR